MNREPVAQQLNSMLSTLDEMAASVRDPALRVEIAAEEIRLGQIIHRPQRIVEAARHGAQVIS